MNGKNANEVCQPNVERAMLGIRIALRQNDKQMGERTDKG